MNEHRNTRPFLKGMGGLVVGVWAWRASRRWRALDYVLRFLLCTLVIFTVNGFGARLIEAGSSTTARFDSVPLTEFEKQGVQTQAVVVHWTSGFKDYRYAARTSDGWYAKTRCVPSESKRAPYIVCIQTLSPDSAGLDAARNHLKITTLR